MRPALRPTALALALALGLLPACGGDDGASVRNLDGTGSGSGSGSASAPAPRGSASGALGGYTPVSDVAAHAQVALDVCEISRALDASPPDFGAAATRYAQGGSSRAGDGSPRTLKGFAAATRDEPIWNDYASHFGDPTWIDTFVTQALTGAGPFAGEADAVRRQGVQKGVQNQVLVAWMLHEVVAAQAKAAAGSFDPASGAPHNWDEAWAFYHGADPACAPYSTADKRGADFGTASAVNDALRAAMVRGREAAVAGDRAALDAAAAEVVRLVAVPYVQAAIRYAARIDGALAGGDQAAARVNQAEGWAFWRVIAPLVAKVAAPSAAAVTERLDLRRAPQPGSGPAVRQALEAAYGALRITPAEVGTLR